MNVQPTPKDAISLQYSFTYLNIFLFAPWYDFKKNDFYKPNLRKFYGALLLLGQVAWIVNYVMDEALHQIYKRLTFTQKLIYTVLVMQLVIFFIFTICKTAFYDNEKWRIFFQNIRHIDYILGNQGQGVELKKFFSRIVVHLIFVVVFSYNLYFWGVALEISLPKTFWMCPLVPFYWQHFFFVLSSVIVNNIKSRYRLFNNKLLEHYGKPEIIQNLEQIVKSYRILGETIDIYNNLFGYQNILMIFQVGNQCLHCLNLIYIYATNFDKDSSVFHILGSNILMLIVFLHNLLDVVFAANSTNLEAKKIFDVCYRLQEQFGVKSQEAEALTKLVRYCKHFNRAFDVAGFFPFDKTIILSMVGNVATYFIIVIQLNESQYLQTDKK